MRIRSTVGAHPVAAASVLAVVLAVTAFVLAYFEPQKLFIDDRVSEPLPTVPQTATASAESRAGGQGRPKAEILTVASGSFQDYEHSTSGRARVLRLVDGSRFLRFENFETSNGPDVRVYLSGAPAGGSGDAFDDDYVELGHLKGNIGDQNYVIPSDLHLGHFQSAVIWCKRFSVAFGAAPLQ